MRKSDYSSIYELYSEVKIISESYDEGTTVLPHLIKVKEIYEGGPHAGETDIVYRIIGRMGATVKGICQNNPELDCSIDIDDPTVSVKDNTYITTANFKWDEKRKVYNGVDTTVPEATPASEVPIVA